MTTTVAEIAVELVLDADDYVKGLKKAKGATDEVVSSFDSGSKSLGDFSAKIEQLQKEAAEAKTKAEGLSKAITDYGKQTDGAGKSSTNFTKQLSKMAKGLIGVATAYAAGRAVTRFITNSIAAARAAGVEAKAIDQLESSWQKLLRLSGEKIIRDTAGAVKVAAGSLSSYNTVLESSLLTTKQLADIGVVLTKSIQGQDRMNSEAVASSSAYADSLTLVGLSADEVTQRQAELNAELAKGKSGFNDSTTAIDGWLEALNRVPTAGDISREKGLRIMKQQAEDARAAEQAINDADAAYNNFFANITAGITGETKNILIGLQFEDLGGDAILEALEAVKGAFASGAISREEFAKLMGFVFAQEEAAKAAAGAQTAWEAGFNIDQLLDLEPGEGRKMVEEWLAGEGLDIEAELDLILGPEGVFQFKRDAELLLEGITEDVKTLGETITTLSIDDKEVVAANAVVQQVRNNLVFLNGKTFNTRLNIKITETTTTSTGGRAHGGPVAAGVPYVVGEVGPELFVPQHSGTIVPNNRLDSITTGGSTRTTNIGTQNFFGIDLREYEENLENDRFLD